MKYILTGNKIIDLTSKDVSSYEIIDDKKAKEEYGEESGFIRVYYFSCKGQHCETDDKGGRTMDNWYLKEVKFADTIEELCDEFVLVASYRFRRPKTATELEKELYEMINFYTDKDDKIYGAIWVQLPNGAWRLEPVAKVNNKGELELI